MKLIEFKEQNVIIAKDQPEYLPMPAHITQDGRVICLWQLTWKERLTLLLKGKLWHTVLTFGRPMQPQLLQGDSPFKPIS